MKKTDPIINVLIMYQRIILISCAWMKRNHNLIQELVHNAETLLINVVLRVPKLRHGDQLVKGVHHFAEEVVDVHVFVVEEVLNRF